MRPPSGTMDLRLRLGVMILLVVIFPVAYVAAINALLPHESLAFQVGWTDQNFSGWTANASQGTSARLSVSNGTLSVISAGTVTAQQFVAADSPASLHTCFARRSTQRRKREPPRRRDRMQRPRPSQTDAKDDGREARFLLST